MDLKKATRTRLDTVSSLLLLSLYYQDSIGVGLAHEVVLYSQA